MIENIKNKLTTIIIICPLFLLGCEQKKFNIKDYTNEKSIDEVLNEYMSMGMLDEFYSGGNLYKIIEEKNKNKFNIFLHSMTNAAFLFCKEDSNIYKFYTEIDNYDGEKLINGRDELIKKFKEKLTHLNKKIEELEENNKKTHVKVPRIVALGLSLGSLALNNLEEKVFVRLFEEIIILKKKIIIYDFTMAKNVKKIFDEKIEESKK